MASETTSPAAGFGASPSAPYDLAIIGGGINGCGIARDAAGRGASVVLFEKDDLASATSSRSTKLIHGGLRYLEYYEFRLVREALMERERLWAIAPHIIRPLRFVLPHHKGLRPAWLLRLGLFLYDHIGGRKLLPATRTLDLAGARAVMDVGGNSGEFVRQICERNPSMTATVFDLPVVCALGRRHVAEFPQAARIAFREGDLRRDPLPAGHDVVSFKSVLHDWPDSDAMAFLGKAADALEPGGCLAIFERMPIEVRGARLPYSMVANLVFLPFFRQPDFYAAELDRLGFVDITAQTVGIEMPFALVTARKRPS